MPETLILETLAAAWNQFLHLPQSHHCDRDEFMRAIHAAQNIVMSRPVWEAKQIPPVAKPVPPHRVVPEPKSHSFGLQ